MDRYWIQLAEGVLILANSIVLSAFPEGIMGSAIFLIMLRSKISIFLSSTIQLEQLGCLRSKIPPPPPPPPRHRPILPILMIHIRSQVKTRQSQSYKFKTKMPNIQTLKFLYKMYKYEMDPTRTVGATERTRDAGRTDGQTDGQSETNIPPPDNNVVRGYNKLFCCRVAFFTASDDYLSFVLSQI